MLISSFCLLFDNDLTIFLTFLFGLIIELFLSCLFFIFPFSLLLIFLLYFLFLSSILLLLILFLLSLLHLSFSFNSFLILFFLFKTTSVLQNLSSSQLFLVSYIFDEVISFLFFFIFDFSFSNFCFNEFGIKFLTEFFLFLNSIIS